MKTVNVELSARPGDGSRACHNLRPSASGQGLELCGRPAMAAPAGMSALLLFTAPDGRRLLCADAAGGLYVRPADGSGGAARPFFASSEEPLCAAYAGGALLVMYGSGLRRFAYPSLKALTTTVPEALPVLLTAGAGRLSCDVGSRTLAGGDYRTAQALTPADARAVEADYRAALAAVAAEGVAQGVLTQPVLARYVLEDAGGNDVFVSPPVLAGRAQTLGVNRLGIDSAGLLQGYTLGADAWRLQLSVPAGLGAAGISRVRVMMSPQFATVLPTDGAADVRLGHGSSGQYTAQVSIGLDAAPEALLESNPAASRRTLAEAVARMAAMERCVAVLDATPGVHVIAAGPACSPEAEHRSLSSALLRPVKAATAAEVAAAPPHGFSARCVAACGRNVFWGNIVHRRFRGCAAGMFAATVADKSWRGFVAVDFADGGRVVRETAASTSAPVTFGPLLSYPAPDATSMTIGLDVAGEPAVCRTFPLSPSPDGRSALWADPSMKPFAISDECGELTVPEAIDSGASAPDCIVAADAAAPAVALASATGFGAAVRHLLPAAGSTAAWDFGRERVAVFSAAGIFTAALSASRDTIASGRIDSRGVDSREAVAGGSDGDVYVLASGALLRLRGRSVATIEADAGGATALAYDATHRELWLLGADSARVLSTALAGMPWHTRGFSAATAAVLDTPCGSLLTLPDGVADISREEAAGAEVAWQAEVALPARFRPRRVCLAMKGRGLRLLAAFSAAGLAGAEAMPGLAVSVEGDVADTLRVGLVSRPVRRMRLRLAGKAGADFRINAVELHSL